MALTLKQYWQQLECALQNFDRNNTIQAENPADAMAFAQQRNFLYKMLALGAAIERNSFLFFKTRKALQLQALPQQTFGENRVITNLPGILSYTFARDVYLPYLQSFAQVTLEDQKDILQLLSNITKQKEEVLVLVNRLEHAIELYKSPSQANLGLQK